MNKRWMWRHVWVAGCACVLWGCGDRTPPATAPQTAAKAPTLLVAPEDLRTVTGTDGAQGPVVIGSIQPERRADLRAEISAVVLQVLKENGEPVKAGELLVRLDPTSIRDGLTSADESVRAASQAYDQAERQAKRLKTLQDQGMISMQGLEDAEVRRNSLQSDLAAAKTRLVTARQQLQRTEVRAPFDGVLSERKVSAGDTAQIGKELAKVIDPRSMRFEGLVSADRMREVHIDQPVSFRVNGYTNAVFTGKVKRIDAAANATTRQVEVLVAFTGDARPQVAGLYAEGHLEAAGTQAVMLPEAAVVRSGDTAYVWRVKDKAVNKVTVKTGPRDARTGDYPLLSGLSDGDRILRNPSSTLVDGQQVELASATASSQAASAAGS